MQYVYPVKVVHTTGNVQNQAALLKKKPLQIGLMEEDLFYMQGKSSIILDFGKELAGGIRILTFRVKGEKNVRLRFGESVSETCAELGGRQNATNDHSNRDFCVMLQSYSDMKFGQTGFRFLRLDTLGEDTELDIKSMVAAADIDQREEIGSFICDDAPVNEIWNTAAYTLRLCLQNGCFWDGIKRDRLVWIGDLYPEMRAAHCLFGDVPETLHSLDFAMNETKLPNWMASMPAYSLWWLIILCDEYWVNGNRSPFFKYLPYIRALIKQISDMVGENGRTSYPGNFIDWPSKFVKGDPVEKEEENLAGMSYLTELAMEKTAVFLKEFGENAALCEDILRRLRNGSRRIRMFKSIAAIGVWAGDKSASNEEVLLRGGAEGLSTFMSYPILTAVATYGHYEQALAMMKEYYGGMLSVGATTFWEDFNLNWLKNCGRIDEMPQEGKTDIHGDCGAFCYVGFRHSLCHGWSAGVIPYLSETVAGLHWTGAGMRLLEISPHLSGLKHVKIKNPTPYGVVTVEHTLQADGRVKTNVSAPEEIRVIVSNQ